MSGEWFRRGTWTPDDEAEFFERLDRARPRNRAQHLRIQALHLEETGSPELVETALGLLDLLLLEYPDELELAAALHQKARCCAALGRMGEAVRSFRDSLQAMRDVQHARTDAHADFALFAVRHGLDDLYEEAITALDEVADDGPLPLSMYKQSAARAILLARTDRESEARIFARRALVEASRTSSGMRYHPGVGLVEDPDPRMEDELIRIARYEDL